MNSRDERGITASHSLAQITRRRLLQSAAAAGATLAADRRFAFAATEGVNSSDSLVDQFRNPPMEYRPVDNWWWEAARVDKEKLRWQLQEFKDKGIGGTWFYVRWVYGEALSTLPEYWSDEWWELQRFALEEQKRHGLDAWFSTWEANGFIQNRIREEAQHNPQLRGRNLVIHRTESERAGRIELTLPAEDEVLDAAAYRVNGKVIDYDSRVVLGKAVRNGRVEWNAPGGGWVLTVIAAHPDGVDYLNPAMAHRWNEVFLGEYEKRLPEFMGTVLKAFGVDEHSIMHGNTLYSPSLLSKVKAERSYDLAPQLIGLFYDIGPATDRVRCDYYDAMSALLEENFCRVAARWLEARGMKYVTASPHDEGELLDQTRLYGDVVRYFRSYHMTGGEDPFRTAVGERRLYSAKFASSIAHLYERKHAIVMAYFFSGWGVTQAENLAWTNENYAYGMNFYDRHGVFYSLMGGWYDYAPPGDHFFQPHWKYWRTFADYVTRLSCIMSQGKHRADVALLYPGTTLHANWVAGRETEPASLFEADAWQSFDSPAIESSERTKELARAMVHDGIDLDVMDDWSLQKARVEGLILTVSGLEFRAIVLPPLTTIRLSSLEKIREFYDQGGTVVSLGRLPSASAENGRDDPRVAAVIEAMFGVKPGARVAQAASRTSAKGGKACFVPQDVHEVPKVVSAFIDRDVTSQAKGLFHTHQKVGERDIYFLFNAVDEEREVKVRFRVGGVPERWDAFTGSIQPIHRFKRDGSGTELSLALEPHEAIIVVFVPKEARPAVVESNVSQVAAIETGSKIVLRGFDAVTGRKSARLVHAGQEYTGETRLEAVPATLEIGGPFDFHLEPTMDNRWGDFRYPAAPQTLGAEARKFRYAEEADRAGSELGWNRPDFDDAAWEETTFSYGPYWWHIGPFQPGSEPQQLLEAARRGSVDLQSPWPRLRTAESAVHWKRYSFSKKLGAPYFAKELGLSSLYGVSENFLVFDPGPTPAHDVRYLFTHVVSPSDADFTFYYGVQTPMPMISGWPQPEVSVPRRTQAWLNGAEILWVTAGAGTEVRSQVRLRKGANSILIKMVQPQEGASGSYAVFLPGEPPTRDVYVPLLRWFRGPQSLAYDITPQKAKRVGWYRFKAPPGLRSMRLKAQARGISAWVDGRSVPVRDGLITLPSPSLAVSQVALRVDQEPGTYGGAVFSEPIAFECEKGRIPLGDWCRFGLGTYSGIGIYGKDVDLSPQQAGSKVLLELGNANTVAELLVNGKSAGVKLSRPFRFDISSFVKPGRNRIEIKVANTLANHMSTYPTPWVFEGQTLSGLLGPVRLQFLAPLEMTMVKV